MTQQVQRLLRSTLESAFGQRLLAMILSRCNDRLPYWLDSLTAFLMLYRLSTMAVAPPYPQWGRWLDSLDRTQVSHVSPGRQQRTLVSLLRLRIHLR